MVLEEKKAINLRGKMSILGVSKIQNNVFNAVKEAGQSFYLMKNMYRSAEDYIASYFKAKDSFITNSASAAILQNIIAIKYILNKETINVGLPLGHHVDYGVKVQDLIQFTGVNVIPMGASNRLDISDLEEAYSKNIDVAFFVLSHHCVQKNHVSPKEFQEFFSSRNVLTIIDAAAEEDIWSIGKLMYDYSIFSGTKAISAPASGFILLNSDFSKNNKNSLEKTRSTIGRAMKIGKESIAGLVEAISNYDLDDLKTIEEKEINIWLQKFTFNNIETSISKDSIRDINRIKLKSDVKLISRLNNHLNKNNIFTRDYNANEGYIELDLRQTNKDELNFTIEKIKEVTNG